VHCEEKYRLLNLSKSSVNGHSAAVDDLAITRGKTSKQDHDRLLALAEEARDKSEAASRALFQHTREHGC